EYAFVHSNSGNGTVRIEVNAGAGNSSGAALVSTVALDPNFSGLLSASVTFTSSDLQSNRLILNDSATALFNGDYLFAQVADVGTFLQFTVNNGSANIYSKNEFSIADIEDGDMLRITVDTTQLISLSYYDASNGSTLTLIGPDGDNAIVHSKNWKTDFASGIYLAQEAINWAADVPVRPLTFDRLQAATFARFIDDTFANSTAPWDSDDWNKIKQTGTEVPSNPADGQYSFAHDGSGNGAVSIAVNAGVGEHAGAAIISTKPLDPNFSRLLNASVKFISSDQQNNRLIFNDNATTLFTGDYLYAQVTDAGSFLQFFVNNGSSNIYFKNAFSVAGIGDGDLLNISLNETHLVSLTYYDASANTTLEMIGDEGDIPVVHEKNWNTDFESGIYLAQEAINWASDAPIRTVTFDHLHAAATQPFEIKAVHLPFRPQYFSVTDYQESIEEIAALGYNTLILGAGGISTASYTVPSPGQLQFNTWSTSQVEDLISYIRNAGLEPVFGVKAIGKLNSVLGTLSQQNPGLITDVSTATAYGVLDPTFTFSDGLDAYEKILLPMLDNFIALHGSTSPRYLLLGVDEVPVDDLQSIATQLGITTPVLFANLVNQCTEHLLNQGITPILWGDMFLGHQLGSPGHGVVGFDHDPRIVRGHSSYLTTDNGPNPPSVLTAVNTLDNKNKIIIADWQYEEYLNGAYPSVDYFQALGFRSVLGATKNHETGIREFSKYASDRGAGGMIATTWDLWSQNKKRHLLPALIENSALYFQQPEFIPPTEGPSDLEVTSSISTDYPAYTTSGGAFKIPVGTLSYTAEIATTTPIDPTLTVVDAGGAIVAIKTLLFDTGTHELTTSFSLPALSGNAPYPYTLRLDLEDDTTTRRIHHELPRHIYAVDQLPFQAGATRSDTLISGDFSSLTYSNFDAGVVYATGAFPALLEMEPNPNPSAGMLDGVLDCHRHAATANVPGLWERIVEEGMTLHIDFKPDTETINHSALVSLGNYSEGFRLLLLSNGSILLQFADQSDVLSLFAQA
ncbi:MAG: hypothetical protein U9P12_04860, partial [Verrucomicrobiota bacterium]|nr:hypothetical protein [Verrucomicrobiota bacterium]